MNKKLLIEIPESEGETGPETPVNLNVAEITSSLYISSYQPARDIEWLREKGITHILNLSNTATVQNLFDEFTYCCLGMADNPKDDIDQHINEAIEFIDECIQNGGKVLIHCYRGKSRAPTIACAYLIKKNHMTTESALRFIKKKQPHACPNFGFVSQLYALEGNQPVFI